MAEELEQGLERAFWAVELVPGKEYNTQLPFDLHITSAVLPASAKDAGRSVVSLTFADEPEKTFSIVSLKLDSHESQFLDVVIDEESTVKFTVSGKNPVHLSGYYDPSGQDPEGLYGDDDEIDSDEAGDEDEMAFDDDEDDVDSDIDEETQKKVNAALAAQLEKKRKAQAQQNGGDNKKAKAETTPQQQQPKKQQNQPTPNKSQQQAGKPQQQQQKPQQQQKVLANGLKWTVTQEGTGTEATKGKKVGVKYVGRLTKNGKVFDASQQKPFVFTLGAREVITGWDLGVAGMKVGEKRQLVIPSDLAYGARGAGKDIPPNSSLTFDVELVHVK